MGVAAGVLGVAVVHYPEPIPVSGGGCRGG